MVSLKGLPRGGQATARFPVAQTLINKGNFKACHLVEGKVVGPSFADIARRYLGDAGDPARLAQKVIMTFIWSTSTTPRRRALRS